MSMNSFQLVKRKNMFKNQSKPIIIFTILVVVIINLSAMSCGKPDTNQQQNQDVKNIQASKIEKNLPKLLDLGAHKCIPCQKMAPILDELTNEYKGILDVEFVDVWQPENKTKAQNHRIQSIPTQIYFDETGKEIWRHVGFISKEDLLAKWAELGYDFSIQNSSSCSENCENELMNENQSSGCCGK